MSIHTDCSQMQFDLYVQPKCCSCMLYLLQVRPAHKETHAGTMQLIVDGCHCLLADKKMFVNKMMITLQTTAATNYSIHLLPNATEVRWGSRSKISTVLNEKKKKHTFAPYFYVVRPKRILSAMHASFCSARCFPALLPVECCLLRRQLCRGSSNA